MNSGWDLDQLPEIEAGTVPTSTGRPEQEGEMQAIPEDVFPVPAGDIGHNLAASRIFPVVGKARKMFMRGSAVHEIASSDGTDYLAQVSPERFCALVETMGKRVCRKEKIKNDDGGHRNVWRSTTFPLSAAKIVLKTDPAKEHLPSIRQLTNCPILTTDCEALGRGYHEHAAGTFISSGKPPQSVTFDAALNSLKGLLCDFDFPTDSDFSRAFASLISPALKMGGWINDDFPLDMAEADKSQSGKTFRQKLVCRIYNEIPTSITISKGGVGSLDEKISGALLKGRPFITLGNIRGRIDSQLFEDALRGAGRVQCRGYRATGEVNCWPFLWQLSTNGAELTRDLANRSIVTRIRKQPEGYEWKRYDEGDLESHVIANQSFYLACVFSILRTWHARGKPETGESRHDFRGWCRALDGIVQMCGLAPLLDGHREQQERTANPNLQWLRDIVLALPARDHVCPLQALDLANVSEDHGIDFPGNPFSKDDPAIRVGRIMAKIFRDADSEEIDVDGFKVSRTLATDYTHEGGSRERKQYVIQKAPNP